MKIVTWNVQGLGNLKKNTTIEATFHKFGPDIMRIQETKKEFVDSKLIRSLWGIYSCEWTFIPSISAVGGLLIAWKPDLFSLVSKEHGFYSLSVKLQGILEGQFL